MGSETVMLTSGFESGGKDDDDEDRTRVITSE